MSSRSNQQTTGQLINAVQELSLARDLDTVMAVVRRRARELTGADGATFVLRDGDRCYYADENAISPLWKGQRFPMSSCISGWVMQNKEHAVIEDIYQDERIPADAYRPTFVKSLAMVPIRSSEPIGAIGNYWADPHCATEREVNLLQALADSTSIALENVQIYAELEQRVRDRTAELEAANQELESFSYSVSHDLRAPLRAVNGFSEILLSDYSEVLDDTGRDALRRIVRAGLRMNQLIEDLLELSRITRAKIDRHPVDLSGMAQEIVAEFRDTAPDRQVKIVIESGLSVKGDRRLLRIVLENLLSNAWKYTSKTTDAVIEFGRDNQTEGSPNYYVRDNGVGFNMSNAKKLFGPFQRMHSADEFPGTGIGLATVQRIIHKHGGQVGAQAAPGEGATFHFTLPL